MYSSQETFLDTPTREKGQFTGDTVDISYANMAALGDRNATERAIREIVYSAHALVEGASSGYCTEAQVPCSFPSLGTPGPRQRRLPQRRQHARHPGLHGVRAGAGCGATTSRAATRRDARRPAMTR